MKMEVEIRVMPMAREHRRVKEDNPLWKLRREHSLAETLISHLWRLNFCCFKTPSL